MSIATITFYDQLPTDADGQVLAAWPAPLASQGLTSFAAATSFDEAPARTRFARLCADTDLHVAHTGSATINSPFVASGAEYVCEAHPDQTFSVLEAA